MLFAYDRTLHEEVAAEKLRLRAVQSLRTVGLTPNDFRTAVRTLMNHDRLLVPTDVALCTPVVERLRAIAHHCNIEVATVAAYLNSREPKQPVAAPAAPPTQQSAVAG